MDSNHVNPVPVYFVFDPEGEVNEKELEKIAQLVKLNLTQQLPSKEETPVILVKNIDFLPPHLWRYFRLPQPNEKWLLNKDTQL